MEENDSPIEYKPKNTASNNSIIETVKAYLSSAGFQHKIIGDTPIDNNQLVPRKYVNLNGTTAQRPSTPVTGQFYFDTTIGRPIFFNGTNFIDAAGSIR